MILKRIKVEEDELFMKMPTALKKELQVLAVREGRTIKDIINEQVENYVKIHKHGNPQHLITSYQKNESFVGLPALGIDFKNKKSYIKKHLQKEGRLNKLGQEAWNHANQWFQELKKY